MRTVAAMKATISAPFGNLIEGVGNRRHTATTTLPIVRVLAAPDKFKGTATAHEVAAAIGHACWELGVDCVELPLADGGDGLLDILGGPNRTSLVTGPLGDPARADWRLSDGTAVIEMARASGLVLAGGADGNRPLDATTSGTGELIDHALDAGARRIIVGLGGSATTDGGFGAIRAITAIARLKQTELLVACDVTTRFTDAAEVFGPQKGASPGEVKLLTRRLERLAQMFDEEFHVDVREIDGGGAAGGLGGALAALGGSLLPGFDLVADELDLYDHLAPDPDDPNAPPPADLVVTGEGQLDATSFGGKVVGGLRALTREQGIPLVAIVGAVADDIAPSDLADLKVVSISERDGVERAMHESKRCIEDAAAHVIAQHLADGGN